MQRIFRVRGLVIVGCFALGLLGGYAAHKAFEHVTYTASARLTLNARVPQDSVESAALAGTVQAIVTSPDQVSGALKQAGASRDIVKFTRSISTQSLSYSGVIELSVTDTDARLATSVANTLTTAAVTAVNQQQRQPSEQLLSQLQTQITAVRAQISGLDAKLAAAESNNAPTAGGLLSQRSDAAQQLTALLTQQTGIEQQLAQTPGASIISPASQPLLPDPSQLALDAIIGALAGLILGIALAALLETRRPTLVGASAIERALQAPVLGVLPARRLSATTLRALSVRLRRAADEAKASTAVLWSPYGVDLTDIARQLQAVSSSSNGHVGGHHDNPSTLTVLAAPGLVNFALTHQQHDLGPLGEIVAELSVATPAIPDVAASDHDHAQNVDLDVITPSPEALASVSPAFALQHQILPYRFDRDHRLHLATTTPSDPALLQLLIVELRRAVRLDYADADAIQRALGRHYEVHPARATAKRPRRGVIRKSVVSSVNGQPKARFGLVFVMPQKLPRRTVEEAEEAFAPEPDLPLLGTILIVRR